ncbi:matrixin family metalloprotease [Candidatus Parcubacteria bacterium]|nr:matrixin family metalloprotease [Candidatus Parcubacteria bacterium]
MKKVGLGILIGIVVLSLSGMAGAEKLIPAADQAKQKAKADNSPVIKKVEDEHLVLTPPGLEKIVFIHHKKDFAKPPWAGEKGKKEAKCYGFLGRGVNWKDLSVSYVIDPSGSNLAEDFVASAISAGAEEWDTHTGAELFNDEYGIVNDGSWDSDIPDGRNELVFGDYPDPHVIAVAVVWGYFSGPPSLRKIIEFDVLFDTDFTWGDATLDSAVMDLQNIATHEIGHGVGLADVYDSACSEVTMYGYSDYGETKKRTLDQPDITGLQTMYGI